MTTTLADLRLAARRRADQEFSTFLSDAEYNANINNSVAELWDLLVSAYGNDYNLSQYNFVTVGNQESYDLPADMYKLRGVDAQITTQSWFALRPYNFNERNRNENLAWGLLTGPTVRYQLFGSTIRFNPAPQGAYNIRLWYTPLPPVLTNDTDTLSDLNSFSEYVIVDAAIKALQKEESDVSVLMQQKEMLKKRIMEMSQNRDAGQPETVADIYAENNEYYFYRT